MRSRQVKIIVNTRHPGEHEAPYDTQAKDAIAQLQDIGVMILYTGKHHRKLAIFDQRVLWEGSLNILSQNDSSEIVRRIGAGVLSQRMLEFIKLQKFRILPKIPG
jgi:hypothetical protein